MKTFVHIVVVAVAAMPLFAQWSERAVTLNPGWNAVFLDSAPIPADCQTAFAGVPIESVWAWNKEFSPVQFIQDPETMKATQPEWLTYYPTNHPQSFLSSFFNLRGGVAYLIKLPSDAGTVTWRVKGTPVVPRMTWVPNSYNLVGFAVDANQAPTFASFFASSPAHANQPVYRLDANAHWVAVNAATEVMQPGVAYWVKCNGASDFAGPLAVQASTGSRADFGTRLTEQTLRIKNNGTGERTVNVRVQPSAASPTEEDTPVHAGDVPLAWWDGGGPTQMWQSLPAVLTRTLRAGEEWSLRLAVRRSDMVPWAPTSDGRKVVYGNVVEVTDSAGDRIQMAMTAEGMPARLQQAAIAVPSTMRAGLWVGGAVVDKVSQPSNASKPTEPVATVSPFQFRLVMHVDSNGVARLLQQVILVWKEGVTTNDPGRFVLVTSDAKLQQLFGTVASANLTGRRISSTVFSFAEPLIMSYDAGRSLLSRTISLGYNDPLNPFRHQYHPDHDNLDERYERVLPDGRESFTVVRDVAMAFTAEQPPTLSMSGWGDTVMGGIYTETLTGLHKDKLYVNGSFALTHVSSVDVLDDGQ